MSQAQKAPEPGMEDLLASIRKAITEDQPRNPGAAAGEARITGSMQELRVRIDEPPKPVREGARTEILELRNRIADQLAERSPQPQKVSGFAGILSGEVGLAPASASPPPPPAAPPPKVAARLIDPPRPAAPLIDPPRSVAPLIDPPRFRDPPSLRQSYDDIEPEAAGPPPEAQEPAYGETRFHDQPPGESDRMEDYDFGRYRRDRETRETRERSYPPPTLPESVKRISSPEPAMLSPEAAAGAEAAFNRLASSLMQRTIGERSVEDMTRELLRSMLKQWLDEHLPTLVERLVREEIERVARRGGR